MRILLPLTPVPKGRHQTWTNEDTKWLTANYPDKGKKFCASYLGRREGSIRWKAGCLGLEQNRNSEFFKDWQGRAAESKIGKKRPAQAEVMRNNHRQGKLKKTPEMLKAMGERLKRQWKKSGHPRGMLGKKHSDITKQAIGRASKARWNAMNESERREAIMRQIKGRDGRPVNQPHGSWKAGWREFGGKRYYYRSRWEANFGRYLEMLKQQNQIKDWMHEPKTFWFDKIKRGCVSYLPDFLVIENNGDEIYYEVKGWMDKRSKIKLQRMKRYYPETILRLVDDKSYRKLAKKVKSLIPDWEGR